MSDSFYLQRVKECLAQSDRYEQVGSFQHTRWIGNKSTHFYRKVTLREITFHEEQYKGYQLIVIGWHRNAHVILDENDQPVRYHRDDFGVRYGETTTDSAYHAYAWKLGSLDDIDHLNYLTAYTTISGIFSSAKEQTTIKSAKKRIDLFAKLEAVRDRLSDICSEYYGSGDNPYNAVVGDEVFIQAHGRKRKGVIVETTGSRFVVGYCTPSNTFELKHKTLSLSQLWIKG